jgi:hypothetical protein
MQLTNFNLEDPVVQFIAPNFEMTLTLISMLYVRKILTDCSAVSEEGSF